jgi:hypothetical protein
MKTTDKSVKANRDFNELISKLSGNEVLNYKEMMRVRGGGGDGNGSDPIIIPPPQPK